MCSPAMGEALAVGTFRASHAFMQHSAQNNRYALAEQARKTRNTSARRSAQLQREQVRAENQLRSRNRRANLFEIEKARIKQVGAENAAASAEDRLGNSVDRAIFDVYQAADQAAGDTQSDYEMGMKMSMHATNAITESLRARLLSNINTTSPGDSGALLMNLAAAGLGAWNHYEARKSEQERAIIRSAGMPRKVGVNASTAHRS